MHLPQNLRLQDSRVLLRALTPSDTDALRPLVFDEDIWRYMPTKISDEQDLQTWIRTVGKGFANGTRYTFIIIDRTTGQVAGSTSYGNISAPDKRLEIGWTWLSRDFRGSGINRHCKYLLLQHAFEVLGTERVELKTDVQNGRSRRAMQKIGATEEGVLRSHTQMHDGRRRDTIYYSILAPEWPGVKARIFPDLAAMPT